jgi:Tol biopolymer transport system component
MGVSWKKVVTTVSIILAGYLLIQRIFHYSPPADPKSDRVAFLARPVSMWSAKNTNFYVVNIDTTGSTRISSNLDHWFPKWSPQGDKIAYFNGDGLHVANVDNIEQKELLWQGDEWGQVWWSPDGSKIASLSSKGIYLFDLENRRNIKQTGIPESREWPPENVAWSPDGSKIAVSSPDGLYVFDAEIDQVFTITLPDQSFNTFDEPDWSSDSSKIALRLTSRVYGRRDPKQPGGIAVIDADGSDLTQLTFMDDDTFPKWSPDGRQIAFVRLRSVYVARPNAYVSDGDIYIMNADGTGLRKLTQNEGIDKPFVWSPDGTRIAFISEDASKCRSADLLPLDTLRLYCADAIKVVDVDSSSVTLIRPSSNEWLRKLVWLPPD